MGYYVSRVEPSHFDPATAYASLDGHRSDDLRPFIFVTHDYGESWESISANLPDFGNVNTVRQDPRNPRLLYAGTEFGFFISLDEGVRWDRFMNGLPTTRIDDVLVHPRDNDLVLASHGRSIWVLDDVTALQDLTPEILAEDVYFFDPREAVLWNTDRRLARAVPGDKSWRGENPPAGTSITYYLKEAAPGSVSLTIIDPQTGNAFRTLDGPGNAGMNRVRWDLRGDPPRRRRGRGRSNGQGPLARPDVYRVTLAVGDRLLDTSITVREDVWMDER